MKNKVSIEDIMVLLPLLASPQDDDSFDLSAAKKVVNGEKLIEYEVKFLKVQITIYEAMLLEGDGVEWEEMMARRQPYIEAYRLILESVAK